MPKKKLPPASEVVAEAERLAAEIMALPGAVRTAAALLNISPLFAWKLAKDEALPGVYFRGGAWYADRGDIDGALFDLEQDVRGAGKWSGVVDPKFGLDPELYGKRPVIEPQADIGFPEDWPSHMRSVYVCGACNHDGVYNQLSYYQRCHGFEPSRFMRKDRP